MKTIKEGDNVRHLNLDVYNSFEMTVIDVDGNEILCEYFDQALRKDIKKTFSADELEVTKKADGGFIP